MADSTELSLQPTVTAGTLRPKVGGEIAFQRVFLELRNGGPESLHGLRLTMEARQGADVICEIDEPTGGGLAPGEARRWDLYDLFLEKGRGFPSKVHLFGIKAALGWDFTVRATVSGTGVTSRAAFRFTWLGDPAGPVTVSLGDLP